MRIVHIADFVSTKLGYQELLLAKWNARHGHDVHVLTSDRNPPAPDYEASFAPLLGPRKMDPGITSFEGVQIHRLPSLLEIRTRILIRGIVKTCREIAPDAVLVHGTMAPTTLIGAHVGRSLRVPVFMDNHMVYSVKDDSRMGHLAYLAFGAVMRRLIVPHVHTFYGVAQECCEFLVKEQGIPAEKVQLLPLGVDTDMFSPDDSAGRRTRAIWGIPDHAFVVAQTGKLDPSKDPITLARAIAPLMARRQDVYCVLVGRGPSKYMEAIRDEFRGEGVEDRYVLADPVPVDELSGVFNASDIIVYPGGTSMSALEAAACGRIVVMNDQPTSRWRAAEGVGEVFSEGDARALADLVAKFTQMTATDLRSKGAAAATAVRSHLSYDSIASQLEGAMAQACSETKALNLTGGDRG